MSVNKQNKIKFNIKNIPINSSLGWLAYGDIAFKAWRKLKQKNNLNEQEKKG